KCIETKPKKPFFQKLKKRLKARCVRITPMRHAWGWGVLFLLIMGGMVFGQTPNRVPEERVALHTIDVTIDEEGRAGVQEQYFFSFFAGEDDQFERDFQENTPSLSAWRDDYAFIHPHIGVESAITNLEFLLNQTTTGQPILTLKYVIPSGIVQEVRTENVGRSTLWRLSDTALLSFISGGRIEVGSQTLIKIILPRDALVDTKNLPPGAGANNNVITLTNFQSNSFTLQYTVLAPIASPIDSGKLVRGFIDSPFFLALLVILLFVVAYVGLNRETIFSQVENYVVDHTEFKGNHSPEKELDAEELQ
ncbi:MAG: hypothetical protein U1C71_04375, partial [archaeon]|nr:hypothetical protein [archaeon]